ncbi:hypothetical protein DFJ58DRAFT_290935 [Suillus subalutaceus]|uniref:uncharacterized protein n=1 Tax=Suillus subalutaceus TaxID=48586 RepID=UPI001B8680F9|nr:uncharacterized protein DFJ58DRAFT_290935 [Suillus subalutaceus]KAG1858957.1 hypothetical protein DFJ58DRAFT_290935 [Suillus subalutaceus]
MLLNEIYTIFLLSVALQVIRLVLIPFTSGTTFSRDTFISTFKQLLKRCEFFFFRFPVRFYYVGQYYLVLEGCDLGR